VEDGRSQLADWYAKRRDLGAVVDVLRMSAPRALKCNALFYYRARCSSAHQMG
jgi:hypothetical protein